MYYLCLNYLMKQLTVNFLFILHLEWRMCTILPMPLTFAPNSLVFSNSQKSFQVEFTLLLSCIESIHGTWLAVWLSGNALASINVVALRQTRLVPGWVTVCGRLNHLGM